MNYSKLGRFVILKQINRLLILTAIISMSGLFNVAIAQEETIAKEALLPPIVINANILQSRDEFDLIQSISVLKDEDLRRKRGANLGDTLSGELGVTSSAYGQGAGRPIIRSLDGPRIQVLENGVNTLDVSSLSPDHAVPIESLNATQIEIIRGPATLLYGGGATGGVINAVTGRIPDKPFTSLNGKPINGNFEVRGNTATEEKTGALNINGGAGQNFSWSAGGFRRSANDYHTPGRNTVRNSSIDSGGLSGGGSIVGASGFLGGSISRFESKYGIPSPDAATIDLKQTRYDLAGELYNPIIGFEKLKMRTGYNDYKHNEIENTGEIATRFKNKGLESRVELLHSPVLNWMGALGVQFQDRNFSALGEEAIIPITKSRSTGLFLLEERNWDRLKMEFGGRFEHATQNPQNNQSREFNLFSGSMGTLWRFIDGYGLGLTATRGERAPATEELYVLGAHHGTASYQTGSSALKKEISSNVDLSLRKDSGATRWTINFFRNYFDNYIFLQNTDSDGDGRADMVDSDGEMGGDLKRQNIAQTGAVFYGAEAEVIFKLRQPALDLRLFTDYVRAKLDNGSNVPRTSPQRFGLELNHKRGPWTFNLKTIYVLAQNRLAELETKTPDYTLVNIETSFLIKETQLSGLGSLRIFLQGRNLLNEEARIHTSYLKDYAPLPGRALVAGIRGEF